MLWKQEAIRRIFLPLISHFWAVTHIGCRFLSLSLSLLLTTLISNEEKHKMQTYSTVGKKKKSKSPRRNWLRYNSCSLIMHLLLSHQKNLVVWGGRDNILAWLHWPWLFPRARHLEFCESKKWEHCTRGAYLGAECFSGGCLDPCYFQPDGAVISACRYGETQVTLCVGSVVGYIHVFYSRCVWRLLSAIRHRLTVPPLNVYISLSLCPHCVRPFTPLATFPPLSSPPSPPVWTAEMYCKTNVKTVHVQSSSQSLTTWYLWVCVFVHCCGTYSSTTPGKVVRIITLLLFSFSLDSVPKRSRGVHVLRRCVNGGGCGEIASHASVWAVCLTSDT